MSYGDNSYGSIPYGDDSITGVVIRFIKNITAMFISPEKLHGFFSKKKSGEFTSE